MNKFSKSAIAALVAVSLVGCSTDNTESAEPLQTATPSISAEPSAVPSSEPTEGGTEIYVYAVPAGIIVGSNEAIAWEALMSPVGEYAAAAMYQAVIDEFGPVEPYVTIKSAEERHIDALIRQLDRYGVPASGALSIVKHKDGTATLLEKQGKRTINRGLWKSKDLAKKRKEILIQRK